MFIDSRTEKKNNKGRFVSFPIINFLVDEGLDNQRKTIFMCLYTEVFFNSTRYKAILSLLVSKDRYKWTIVNKKNLNVKFMRLVLWSPSIKYP